MEKVTLQNDLKVFGFQVKSFPLGIEQAFDELMSRSAQPYERPYYGLSECTPDGIAYIAAALEKSDGEGDKYGYETYVVEKGDYLAVTVMDWLKKTDSIKGVFEDIMKDNRADNQKPAVEVYKNDDEMVCMVKIDERKEMLAEFDNTMDALIRLLSSLDEPQLNTIPFEGSWTAAQLADHMHQSNSGFAQLINGPVEDTDRNIDEWVATIKKDFNDMSIKMQSPKFVWPKSDTYKQQEILHPLRGVQSTIGEAIKNVDLSKTCSLFELPVCGYLTRKEAIWFVISHTQRHVRQLENIVAKVK